MKSFFAEIPDWTSWPPMPFATKYLNYCKGWFQATGAAVATCTALLIALDQPTLASLASVGGGGGALWLVTKAMEEILSRQMDLKTPGVLHVAAIEVGAEALTPPSTTEA